MVLSTHPHIAFQKVYQLEELPEVYECICITSAQLPTWVPLWHKRKSIYKAKLR